MYCILNVAASHLKTFFVIIKSFDMIKMIKLCCRCRYSVSKRLVKWTWFKVSPYCCLDMKIYFRCHLCWIINFYAFVGCSSVQLTYSYFCKTSINLQPAKQGLFSVTSGIVYSSRLHELCLNFAVQIF